MTMPGVGTPESGERHEQRTLQGEYSDELPSGDTLGNVLRQSFEQIKESVSRAAEELFYQQRGVVVEKCRDINMALDKTRDSMRRDDQLQMAQVVEFAGEKIESLSDCIGGMQMDRLISEARAAVQRNPLLLIGGSLAVGFIIGRLLKASVRIDGEKGLPDAGGG